jgi:soluble lytic murein transglycosylase-like protein
MGKLCLIIAVIIFTTFSVSAQTRQRFADNFDMQNGVKIYSPTLPDQSAAASKVDKSKKQEAKTAKAPVVINLSGTKSSPGVEMSDSRSLGGLSTGNPEVDNYLVQSSLKYKIDPLLIYAQMSQESSFKQKAISYKGARGYMQLMPATAVRFGVTDIFDPRQNIDAGVKYMRWLLNKFSGDVRLALAGYNAGEGAVMKYGNAIPPYRETQDYVKRITAHYSQIKNLNLNNTVAAISTHQAPEIK